MSGRIFDGATFGRLGNMKFESQASEYGGWWRIEEDERRRWVEE